jgi:hypothetical protein
MMRNKIKEREKPTQIYVQTVPDAIRRDCGADGVGLWAAMRSFGPICYASLARISKETGFGLQKIRRIQAKLRDKGWILLKAEGRLGKAWDGKGRHCGIPREWALCYVPFEETRVKYRSEFMYTKIRGEENPTLEKSSFLFDNQNAKQMDAPTESAYIPPNEIDTKSNEVSENDNNFHYTEFFEEKSKGTVFQHPNKHGLALAEDLIPHSLSKHQCQDIKRKEKLSLNNSSCAQARKKDNLSINIRTEVEDNLEIKNIGGYHTAELSGCGDKNGVCFEIDQEKMQFGIKSGFKAMAKTDVVLEPLQIIPVPFRPRKKRGRPTKVEKLLTDNRQAQILGAMRRFSVMGGGGYPAGIRTLSYNPETGVRQVLMTMDPDDPSFKNLEWGVTKQKIEIISDRNRRDQYPHMRMRPPQGIVTKGVNMNAWDHQDFNKWATVIQAPLTSEWLRQLDDARHFALYPKDTCNPSRQSVAPDTYGDCCEIRYKNKMPELLKRRLRSLEKELSRTSDNKAPDQDLVGEILEEMMDAWGNPSEHYEGMTPQSLQFLASLRNDLRTKKRLTMPQRAKVQEICGQWYKRNAHQEMVAFLYEGLVDSDATRAARGKGYVFRKTSIRKYTALILNVASRLESHRGWLTPREEVAVCACVRKLSKSALGRYIPGVTYYADIAATLCSWSLAESRSAYFDHIAAERRRQDNDAWLPPKYVDLGWDNGPGPHPSDLAPLA